MTRLKKNRSDAVSLEAFSDCLSVDRPRLQAMHDRLQRSQGDRRAVLLKDFEDLQSRSRAALMQRHGARPRPDFPAELPVTQKRADIIAAIQAHQVVIVCGETGSGKTTQLPKICLELGRGVAGVIGHTQPRRLAARATASRIAQELKSELGAVVGYKVRFTDRTAPGSYIKLMTDGILLAETQGDPLLSAYDTLIIDEAHERSLNIDFLLGYLKTLLPRRSDLKLIITSATLDAAQFSRHFSTDGNPAPVIEVSGRLYPIELRYRPVDLLPSDQNNEIRRVDQKGEGKAAQSRRNKERDQYDAIVDAVDEAQAIGPGGTLVFLPGEREIREAAEALRKAHHAAALEVLPLFARQSAQEQARIFKSGGARRVVLATNVAETSLTVPGIRYVIDTGLARIKRYSVRNKVEQLQVEKISQAAASQRAGRCGRVMDGVCIRLYDEEDLSRRDRHTDPEILRSSLAGVILRMKALKLGAVEAFPFIDPPTSRMIGDGYQLLVELGAVTDDVSRALTPIGVELARLPVDPRIGRMILAARDRGCLGEVLIIAAALSVQDPRERPQDAAAAADQAHARFRGGERDRQSEFLWYCALWQAWQAVIRHESGARQRAWCKTHFLSWLRLREWRDVHAQLVHLCAEHGWKENTEPAGYEAIHKALLAGLLGHVGCRADEVSGSQAGSYLGARGLRFWPHPGSALARKAGKWIVCAELVDTSRLFGRTLARIEPEWIEEVGAHLLRREISEPHWSKTAGAVRAWERGVLHGLTVYARRSVSYRDVDPELCRRLLIGEGLVQGNIAEEVLRNMPFLRHNLGLIAEIERLEHKSRRPDVLVDEALIQAFYEQHLPETICDVASLESWRKTAEREAPRSLFLTRDQLMRHEAEGITTDRFPASLSVFGQTLHLSYLHAPGEAEDGVTLEVPLAMLNQIPAHRCEWLVPGLLAEKVVALLRTLPQKHRHRLQPLTESAEAFLELVDSGGCDQDQGLLRALQRFVEERVSLKLPLEAFKVENLGQHFHMNFRLIDEHGRILGRSRSLADLRSRFGRQVAEQFRTAARVSGRSVGSDRTRATQSTKLDSTSPLVASSEGLVLKSGDDGAVSTGLTGWTCGPLPELLSLRVAGREVIGFPAFQDDGNSVSLRPFDTPEEASRVHRSGLIRLFALELREQVRAIERLPDVRQLALAFIQLGGEVEFKIQLVRASLERVCLTEPLPSNADEFQQRCASVKTRLTLVAQEFVRLAQQIMGEYANVQKRLTSAKGFPEASADIRGQLDRLLTRHFLVEHPWERLVHLPRYLKAVGVRLEKLRNHPERDAAYLKQWRSLHEPFERELEKHRRVGVVEPELEAFRWLLEELRVSLFAQELKTPLPISVKRLQKIWESRSR